jgi:pimeloyl-ACP methyl ester carboxylesterase
MRADFPHVEGVSHRYVDAGGLRMHLAEAGPADADPVLLLHGWPQHWFLWREVIGPLAERYRVLCLDLRGLGWTDSPASGYEKENLAADTLAALDALGIERVRLVGHDWGGWIGYLIALRQPDRVERLLTLNILPPFIDFRARNVLSLWRLAYQLVLAAPFLGTRVAQGLADRSERFYEWAGMGPRTWSERERAIFLEPLREPDRARATVQYYRSFQLRELLPIAAGRYQHARLRPPTLLLFGTRDGAQDHRALRGVERHADDFTVELVEGCGHFIVDERPALVTQRALEFL